MTSQNNLQSFFVCPNLILMKNSKVLLLRRMDWAPFWPNYWHCVTGKMEQGETPKQTIIREAFEEVGQLVMNHGVHGYSSLKLQQFFLGG